MRIAIDAREIVGRPTGVGRYLLELIARWSESSDASRHEWRLYAHAPPVLPERFASAVEVLPGTGGTRWEQWSLARALGQQRPDVLFAPGYTAPLTAPCPTALTIHDVSFFAHPEWFAPREGARRRRFTAWSARRAATVLTDSAFSRDEIARHIGIPVPKIHVIPLGITRHVHRAGGGRQPVILYVGSLFRRRHVDRLIAAFVESVAPRVPDSRLEIVGENRTYPAMDFDALVASLPANLRRRVALRSYVDDDILAALYGCATVFAFPSEYEGFGLTPLEALEAGIPSVVLDTPIAREVYGPAARYVKPELSNPTDLADALVELLTRVDARADILEHADEVLARYDWDRTATATLQVIEEAAGV